MFYFILGVFVAIGFITWCFIKAVWTGAGDETGKRRVSQTSSANDSTNRLQKSCTLAISRITTEFNPRTGAYKQNEVVLVKERGKSPQLCIKHSPSTYLSLNAPDEKDNT